MGFGRHSNSNRRAGNSHRHHHHGGHHHHHHGGGWRNWHSGGAARFGRSGCSAIWCCLCTGPILLIIGIALLAAGSTNYRDDKIQDYNAGVKNWVDGGFYNHFNALPKNSFDLEFARAPGQSPGMDKLVADVPLKDSGRSRDKHQIAEYTDHQAVHKGTMVLDVSLLCDEFRGCDTDPRLGRFEISMSGGFSTAINMPLFTYTSFNAEFESDCPDGAFWDSRTGECREYRILDGVSVKVVRRTDGSWAVDNSYGGPGSGEGKGFSAGYYKALRIIGQFPTQISFPITVRDVHDPRVVFYRLMGGGHSLDFGDDGTAKTVAGVVLVVLGCIIITALICIVVAITKCAKKAVVGDRYQNLESGGGGGGGGGSGAPVYAAAPAQPAPAYGGYAAPMPGYGQPAQGGYVQPQPGYGQPQPGYAQGVPYGGQAPLYQ